MITGKRYRARDVGKESAEKKRNGEDYEWTGQGVRLVLEPEITGGEEDTVQLDTFVKLIAMSLILQVPGYKPKY